MHASSRSSVLVNILARQDEKGLKIGLSLAEKNAAEDGGKSKFSWHF